MEQGAVINSAVLNIAVNNSALLNSTVFKSTVPNSNVLKSTALHCPTMPCTAPRFPALPCSGQEGDCCVGVQEERSQGQGLEMRDRSEVLPGETTNKT